VAGTDGVSTGRRVFVLAVLAAVVVAGFGGVEEWPLTGWRLYSRLRSEHSVAWRAVSVDDAARETVIDPQGLPLGFRHVDFLLRQFPDYDRDEREEVCEALADGERDRGRPVEEVRIYRVVQTRDFDEGEVRVDEVPSLRYVCARSGPQ
jgi:hypothetical protein